MTTHRVSKVAVEREVCSQAAPRPKGPKKQGGPVEQDSLRTLWMRAVRRYVPAQQELHRRLLADPSLNQQIQVFVAERARVTEEELKARGIKLKPVKPLGAWERNRAHAGKFVSVVEGGLPTLGKRR